MANGPTYSLIGICHKMKILVIADIHANYRALKASLDAFDNVDEVWCLGDIVEYGPMPSACIDLVRQHCDQVVAGNHDLSFAKCQPQTDDGWTVWFPHNTPINDLDYLNNLPTLLTLERDGISYCLVHGSPSNHLTGRFDPYTEEAETGKTCSIQVRTEFWSVTLTWPCDLKLTASWLLIQVL